jgi:fucose 4-O-acetylase-like acetyltransferase
MSAPGIGSRLAFLDLARVIAMVLVLLVHSPVTGGPAASPAVRMVKDILGSGAVPLFFILSGYLAARKINDPGCSVRDYARDKVRSLIIPFLFWNGLVLSLVFAAKALGAEARLRGSGGYFDVELSPVSAASALLGIGRWPIVYQFWFLRDLIVVSLLAWIVCRHVRWVGLLLWPLFLVPVPMAGSLAYFLLGYSLEPYGARCQGLGRTWLACFCGVWLAAGWLALSLGGSIPAPLRQIGSAIFILALSLIASQWTWGRTAAVLGSSTFFIYASHEPLQTLLAKAWFVGGWPGYGSAWCFLLVPLVVFPACLLAYHALRRWSPAILAYATGGR